MYLGGGQFYKTDESDSKVWAVHSTSLGYDVILKHFLSYEDVDDFTVKILYM